MKNRPIIRSESVRRFTAAALLLLTVQAWALPFTSVASALCLGEDGHIEIEMWANGQCASDHSEHDDQDEPASLTASCEPGEDHCGECVDIPLNGLDAACVTAKVDSVDFSQRSLYTADVFAVTAIQPNTSFDSHHGIRLQAARRIPVYLRTASFLI